MLAVLDVLSCIETTKKSPFATIGPAMLDLLEELSTAIVILLDWDDERARFIESIREHGVAIKAVVVRATPPTQDPGAMRLEGGPIQLFRPDEIAGVDVL